jgi:hypothetical protein
VINIRIGFIDEAFRLLVKDTDAKTAIIEGNHYLNTVKHISHMQLIYAIENAICEIASEEGLCPKCGEKLYCDTWQEPRECYGGIFHEPCYGKKCSNDDCDYVE